MLATLATLLAFLSHFSFVFGQGGVRFGGAANGAEGFGEREEESGVGACGGLQMRDGLGGPVERKQGFAEFGASNCEGF
jgi:hypothetical protein